MQPFTKQLIFDRIADSNYVFWTLYLCNGYKNQSHVLTYYGVDFDATDTPETMIEKSIAKLDNVVSSFPPDAVFSIELKNSKSANGNGIIGPFQFSNMPPAENPPQTPQNLSGAPLPLPYLTKETLDGITAQLEQNFNARLENYKAESLLREKDNELKRRERELDERINEVNDLKKAYESGVAKSADILFAAGKKLIMAFIPALVPAETAAAPVLGDTPPETAAPENDPKAVAVDDLANYVYNNFSVNDIQQIKTNMQNVHTKYNETKLHAVKTESTNADGTTTTE